MVCKHAQYIYIYTYIHTYCTRCLRFPIPFVEDNGERTNGWTADRASNDTASSINFHLFFRLVNLNTVTKIRLDIYADISRPVYIRSPLERIARILKKKENRTNFVFHPSDHEFHIRYRLLLCYAYDFRCSRSDSARRKRIGIGDVTERSKASSKRSHCIEGWTVTEYGWPLYGAKINRHTRIGYAFKGWRA